MPELVNQGRQWTGRWFRGYILPSDHRILEDNLPDGIDWMSTDGFGFFLHTTYMMQSVMISRLLDVDCHLETGMLDCGKKGNALYKYMRDLFASRGYVAVGGSIWPQAARQKEYRKYNGNADMGTYCCGYNKEHYPIYFDMNMYFALMQMDTIDRVISDLYQYFDAENTAARKEAVDRSRLDLIPEGALPRLLYILNLKKQHLIRRYRIADEHK